MYIVGDKVLVIQKTGNYRPSFALECVGKVGTIVKITKDNDSYHYYLDIGSKNWYWFAKELIPCNLSDHEALFLRRN